MRVAVFLSAAGLLLASCATRGEVDAAAPPTDETTAPSDTTTTTSSRPDLGLAEAGVLREEDLPAEWVECCPPEIPGEDQLREHICGSPDGLPPRTAAYVRQFSRNLQPDGTEDGHMLSAVYLSSTEQRAIDEFTGVDAPTYEECVIEDVTDTAVTYRPDRTAAPTVTFERATISLEVPASLDRFVATIPVGAQTATMYSAILRLRVDRALVRLQITTFGEPASIDLLEDLGTRSIELLRETLSVS